MEPLRGPKTVTAISVTAAGHARKTTTAQGEKQIPHRHSRDNHCARLPRAEGGTGYGMTPHQERQKRR
jgi:hypothetical protein